ncbi:hypothetical protein CU084_00805 [Bacillus velezensis]|nr:hypothetical protein CU084_00805 [Bacillus velezensis]
MPYEVSHKFNEFVRGFFISIIHLKLRMNDANLFKLASAIVQDTLNFPKTDLIIHLKQLLRMQSAI